MNKTINFIKNGIGILSSSTPSKEAKKYLITYILIIASVLFLWNLFFVWLPSRSMVEIEGTVTDIRGVEKNTRMGGSNIYYIKLDKYNSPVKLSFFKMLLPSYIGWIDIRKGENLKMYIKKSEILLLNKSLPETKSLNQYKLSELSSLPRVYSITINNTVVVRLTHGLWNKPISILGMVMKLASLIIIIFSCLNIGTTIKILSNKKNR